MNNYWKEAGKTFTFFVLTINTLSTSTKHKIFSEFFCIIGQTNSRISLDEIMGTINLFLERIHI